MKLKYCSSSPWKNNNELQWSFISWIQLVSECCSKLAMLENNLSPEESVYEWNGLIHTQTPVHPVSPTYDRHHHCHIFHSTTSLAQKLITYTERIYWLNLMTQSLSENIAKTVERSLSEWHRGVFHLLSKWRWSKHYDILLLRKATGKVQLCSSDVTVDH